MRRFIAVVVLYKADKNLKKNINSYINFIDKLYVIDNTPGLESKKNMFLIYDNVEYIHFGINKGISYAINFVLQQLNENDLLMTMDQDTSFLPNMMCKYKDEVKNMLEVDPSIASFAANYGVFTVKDRMPCMEIERTITSGNIIRVDIAKKIGGFNEDLFIDEVDLEFCYRLRKKKYKIVLFKNIILDHHFGEQEIKKIFNRKIEVRHYSPMRHYYIMRNKLFIIWNYPRMVFSSRKYINEYLFGCLKELVKIILFEKEKKEKIKACNLAIIDFLHSRYGKAEYWK